MIILIDGFIASVVLLIASKKVPKLLKMLVFCHLSNENAHFLLLKYLNVEPLQIKLEVREGLDVL